MRILLFSLFFTSLLHCNSKEAKTGTGTDYPQKLDVDITAADSAYLSRFECFDSILKAAQRFEVDYQRYIDVQKALVYAPILFRYRDARLLPLFRDIAADSSVPDVYRCAAVNVLGSMRDSTAVPVLYGILSEKNDVLTELAINALGKCGNREVIPVLDSVA